MRRSTRATHTPPPACPAEHRTRLRARPARRTARVERMRQLSSETVLSVELSRVAAGSIEPEGRDLRLSAFRRRIALSILGALVVSGVLAFVLAGQAGKFSLALRTAPTSLLAVA